MSNFNFRLATCLLVGFLSQQLSAGAVMEPFIFSDVVEPFGVSRDSNGAFFIADFRQSHRVIRLNLETKRADYLSAHGFIAEQKPLAAGSGPGQFNMPHSIAFSPEGNILVTEFGGQRLQLFTKTGQFMGVYQRVPSKGPNQDEVRFLSNPLPAPLPVTGVLSGPATAFYGPDGNIYVADYSSHSIQKISPRGEFLGRLGAALNQAGCQGWHQFPTVASSELGGLNYPHMVAFDSANNLYVADTANHRIQRFELTSGKCRGWLGANAKGEVSAHWKYDGSSSANKALGAFSSPTSIQFSKGYLLVGEHGNSRVQRFLSNGQFSGWMGADSNAGISLKWRFEGASTESSIPGGFSKIYDAKLFNDLLVVADSGNKRVQFFKNLQQ